MTTLIDATDTDEGRQAYLKSLHTKQLMGMRQHGEYHYARPDGITNEMVLAELNTREHVPNKIEARLIRQQKAKNRR